MNKIKEIVGLWFDGLEEAKCKQLYPDDCRGCPFLFKPDSKKEDMACNTIWSLFEVAANAQGT
jgi:hypothetical protein